MSKMNILHNTHEKCKRKDLYAGKSGAVKKDDQKVKIQILNIKWEK